MKIKYSIPFIILFTLLTLLWYELFHAKPTILPSALVGEPVPAFQLPNILQNGKSFTHKDLQGKVCLLNVWATWCAACIAEESMLIKIKNEFHVPIYGIDYKDKPRDIKNWLAESDNPFVMIGDDKNGDVGIDLGVYGTPETFVINRHGNIVYRHIGILDETAWNEVLYPLIQKLQAEQT